MEGSEWGSSMFIVLEAGGEKRSSAAESRPVWEEGRE